MLDVLEKLLILQDRDRKIHQLTQELARIGPERQMFETKAKESQAGLDAAKQKANHIESERKELELQVEQKKDQIIKYSNQQFQTKKNEEYQALAKEIKTCKKQIEGLEDRQIEFMEEAEGAAREIKAASEAANQAKALADGQIADLNEREGNLKKSLEELEAGRGELASAVEPRTLSRYERLIKTKGSTVVVGIDRGICGGCHMKLTRQTVIQCQQDQEIAACTNCGRILYYTRDMVLEGEPD